MRVPRDLGFDKLSKRLESLEYVVLRRESSHVTLLTIQGGEHRLWVPDHNPIAAGTLRGILESVAVHFDLTSDELLRRLKL